MPNDFKLELGHRFTMKTDPAPGFDGVIQCEVLSFEVGRSISFSWKGGPIDTVVSFIISSPTSETSKLLVKHSGFSGMKAHMVKWILLKGWKSLLTDKLESYLKKGNTNDVEA